MTGRDGSDASTRLALVPEHDEIDWTLSSFATDVLEAGTLAFEDDAQGARWVKRLAGDRWYCMGDGKAVLAIGSLTLAGLQRDRRRKPFLRVGEQFYKVWSHTGAPSWDGEHYGLQLLDLCAPVEDLAEEADEQWGRPAFVEGEA